MIIYLCVKTHAITGLKYLCQTKKKNPFKYSGSGIDWKTHLKLNGTNHHTEIIKECSSHEELSFWGRYYSTLWNIVSGQDDFGNKIWANRIPETGGGSGAMPGIHNPMFGVTGKQHPCSRDQTGNKNPMYGKIGKDNPNFGQKRPGHSAKMKGRAQSPESVAARVAANTGLKRPITTCPYCGKTGASTGMKQWHFEKCKYK